MRLLAIGALTLLGALAGATADELPAKHLPGNKPCPYPTEAQKAYVAGPVQFAVQVRPDGSAASVEVRKVPLPRLGFEDAVRACVSEWRFEPAPAGIAAMRRYEGQLRFRLDAAEESAIRALLDRLAAEWNAGNMTAVEELALRASDTPKAPSEPGPSLREQLAQDSGEQWRMELEPDVKHLRFLAPDTVSVGQRYRRMDGGSQSGDAARAEELTLDVFAAKGSRGWRFVRVSPVQIAWLEGVRVGGTIREPRKIKNVPPRYPEGAKAVRIQGAVILDCLITAEGKVTSVRLLRGVHPLLDAAAIEAVRQWEYMPTLLDGQPVPVILTATVNFRLG